MRSILKYICLAVIVMVAGSCSTTRALQEGEYRLTRNRIDITNDNDFNTNQLTPYLQQRVDTWNPGLYIYNWANGRGNWWDRFVKSIGVPPVAFNEDLVSSTINNFSNHLTRLGYYESKIESDIVLKGKRKVEVIYTVTLGKRIPIEGIEIVLPERGEFTNDFIADTSFTIKVGDWLSEDALEKETVRSAARMRNLGYYDFNKNHYFFEADTLTEPGKAYLKLTIKEYTRNEKPSEAEPIRKFYFNDVSITYPKTMKVKSSVLKDLNTIVPGDLYSEDIVNNSYSRFSSLNIFSSVNIGMTPVDTNLVNAEIKLSQSKAQGFKFNVEGSSNTTGLLGISPQISYFHKNIFNGGEWLNLSFMGNFQFKFNDDARSNEFGFGAGLSFPRLFPLPYSYIKSGTLPRTEINLSYNYQDRPEYTRNIISTVLGYNGNSKNRYFYQVYPIQLNIINIFNLDENFYKTLAGDPFMRNAYQNHFDLGSGAIINYTTNPENIPTYDYHYVRFQFDIAGNLLSAFKPLMRKDASGAGMIWSTPFSQFIRAEATFGKTWVFGRHDGQSIATRVLAGAGIAYGNSTSLPFEKHFYSGGSNSMRGWQVRTLGPGISQRDQSFVIPNQTGDMKLEANFEYRFDIVWKIAGAGFIDVGNVWTLNDKTSNEESMFKWRRFGESLAANWGVGLRFNLGFLLLRFDWGFKVHDPARENKWVGPDKWLKSDGSAFHFGVGYPF